MITPWKHYHMKNVHTVRSLKIPQADDDNWITHILLSENLTEEVEIRALEAEFLGSNPSRIDGRNTGITF